MSEDLYREASTTISKVNDLDLREEAFRIYCSTHGSTWNLQVRGPLRIRNGRRGKDFVVATAYLTIEDLLALRKSIDKLLDESGVPKVRP